MSAELSDAVAALHEGRVLIGVAVPERFASDDEQARLARLLDSAERERAARFRFERDRTTYVVAHALTRTILSAVVAEQRIAPAAWRFSAGSHGKPGIASPAPSVPLRFNLSHTTGLVACAVALGADLGVDVEYRARRAEIDRLADSVLSERERAELGRHAGARRRHRFFQYWTLKEAYIKGVGIGLGLPLQAITFDPDAPSPSVSFGPELDDDGSAWSFCMLEPTGDHQLALALRARLAAAPCLTFVDI